MWKHVPISFERTGSVAGYVGQMITVLWDVIPQVLRSVVGILESFVGASASPGCVNV